MKDQNNSRNLQSWITPKEKDYSQWYIDILQFADLTDESPVKGCFVIKPYWYWIRENIKNIFDKVIKESWHKNTYFPILIPESFLNKEKDHVEGFAPECAVVTHWWWKELEEPLVLRPTSETIMYSTFSKWVQSWRDLPLLINQWANVIRREKKPRPFLRTTEFMWQEWHTVHASAKEAHEHCITMLNKYYKFMQDVLLIPIFKWKKSEKEKFAWAINTYSVEAMMQDWKSLQMGTSHFFDNKFAKVFDIKFTNKAGEQEYAYQTSWGISTRMIGWIIMTHSDNNWLVLPPDIAPIQIVILPIYKWNNQDKIKEKVEHLNSSLSDKYRIEIDDRDYRSIWFKSYEWEKKWVPIRIEIWPKDLENNNITVAIRYKLEKTKLNLEENISKKIDQISEEIKKWMFAKANDYRKSLTFETDDYKTFIEKASKWFVKTYWCEWTDCENKIKDQHWITTRNIPFDQNHEEWKCIVCWKKTKTKVFWAKSY